MRSQPLFSPRTRRTIWRVALCALVPLLALMALRLIWGWEASHRLAKVIAQLKAEGVQFEPPAVNTPEDQDPQATLLKAVQAISLSSEERDLLSWGDDRASDDLHWNETHMGQIRAIVERNSPAFSWIDKAAFLSGAPHKLPSNSDVDGVFNLCHLLYASALVAHEDHRDLESLLALHRVLVASRIFDQNRRLYCHVNAMALRAGLAAGGLERLDGPLVLQNELQIQQARALLLELNDMKQFQAAAPGAWDGEIAHTKDWFERQLGLDAWWILPLRTDEEARDLLGERHACAGTWLSDWPSATSYFSSASQPLPLGISNLQDITIRLSMDQGTAEEFMRRHFRAAAQSRASAILLAARLYEHTHGRLPDALSELVPDLLPETPVDPFSPRGDPLRYRKDLDGPTVWSVGENGTDDGGITQFDPDGKKKPRWGAYPISRDQLDLIFGAAWTHAKPPATLPN